MSLRKCLWSLYFITKLVLFSSLNSSMGFYLLFTAISAGDEIQQKESSLSKEEGLRVSLECTFSTTSTYYYIHWYRQYPGTGPQFILFSGSDSYSAEFTKERFSSSADKASGKASLSISRVQLEDSAVYYLCISFIAKGERGKEKDKQIYKPTYLF
uniref:Ig-like domain-containing protein n=1 Tax=Scleropages formosus TaxID=113540 RepID=A0A8C9WPP5_SCLFO